MAKLPVKHTEHGKKAIIPNGVAERREFLKNELSKYKDKTFYNKSLGLNIVVLDSSIDEIAGKACMFRKSTELAMFLPHILRNATVIQMPCPVTSKTQRKKPFNFVNLAILRCNVKNAGIAKVTVGFRKSGWVIEYCITSYQYIKKTSHNRTC